MRSLIEEIGIIPAIRVSSTEDALFAAEAVSSSGIPIVEVTMTVPGAHGVISELARTNPKLVVGAGTVLDLDVARRSLDVGAKFLTSPGLDLELVDSAVKNETMVFPGAMTPTEVMMAWKAGSDFVKVFPCAALSGPIYIKALKSPFPHVSLIASGGVNQHNATEFILAGAAAIGIGRHLIQPDAIKRRERDWIRELSHRYFQMVQEARSQRRGGSAGSM
ncbi:MAG TPA: bifunctional 4-hydroxy-2-oxoglutarate aldolase/2-dehydro-3-deoxy-phosphogluconate aldolase [Bryobacteraceae bacterium]|nr:bifunctional 4-hydroxy-2-oxoglutarate aldolase/2-dehydro-3-deoxy-phosphogluconate aldolase [Bryobacteraceae bacterium]